MRYTPAPIPKDCPPALGAYLARDLARIAADTMSHVPALVTLTPRGTAPPRPRDGMIVYADGVAWNPGDGPGFYGFEEGAWRKL
jgi:hypothetical protein